MTTVQKTWDHDCSNESPLNKRRPRGGRYDILTGFIASDSSDYRLAGSIEKQASGYDEQMGRSLFSRRNNNKRQFLVEFILVYVFPVWNLNQPEDYAA